MNIGLRAGTGITATLILARLMVPPGSAETVEGVRKPYEIVMTDIEAVQVVEAIKIHIYSKPPSNDTIKIYDKDRGDVVVLTYKRVNTNPDCIKMLGEDFMAICVEFDGPRGDQYELWFTLRRRPEANAGEEENVTLNAKPTGLLKVHDVMIKSVNGVERFAWGTGDTGNAKEMPDADVSKPDLLQADSPE